jgi:hypothetical protein
MPQRGQPENADPHPLTMPLFATAACVSSLDSESSVRGQRPGIPPLLTYSAASLRIRIVLPVGAANQDVLRHEGLARWTIALPGPPVTPQLVVVVADAALVPPGQDATGP